MFGIFGGAKEFDGIVSDTGTHGRLDSTNAALGTLDTDLVTAVGDGGFQDPVTGSGILGYLASVYSQLLTVLHVTPQGSLYVSQKYGTVDSSVGAGNTDTGTPRVVIATNQAALPVSSSTLATLAGQTTSNASLSSIATNTSSNATAANQTTANTKLDTLHTDLTSTLAVSAAALPLPSGASTSANQTSTNTKLDTLHADLGHMVDGTQQTQVIAAATNGYTLAKLVGAATTNATSLKASAGTVGLITAANTATTPRYLKLYNKASAPTVGTDVPVAVFIIPGSTTTGAGTNIPVPPQGLNFSTGIAYAITTGITDADTTAPGANEVVVTFGYK